jgi:hypothetical protein
MKISSSRPAPPAARAREARGGARSAGTGFALPVEPGASPPLGAAAARPLAALGAVLAVQEAPDERPSRRRAVVRGHDLLDRLHDLRLSLLQGAPVAGAIERLAALVDAPRPEIDDPALARALAEIELRAAVELAKLRRAPG